METEEDKGRYVASSDEDRRQCFRKKKANFFCFLLSAFIFFNLLSVASCSGEVEHLAEPIAAKDSLLFMHSVGINTFISDSGVMRYHMVVEEWDIYNGDVDLFVQSDTAYLHKQQLWELRGRVVVRNVNGDVFRTEELFWDLNKHEMWNYQYMHITTPERELEGTHFYSNEQMTKYSVLNSTGTFPVQETEPANR